MENSSRMQLQTGQKPDNKLTAVAGKERKAPKKFQTSNLDQNDTKN